MGHRGSLLEDFSKREFQTRISNNSNCINKYYKQICIFYLKKNNLLVFLIFGKYKQVSKKNCLAVLSQSSSSTIAVWYTCSNTADDQIFPCFIFSVPLLHVKLSPSGWTRSTKLKFSWIIPRRTDVSFKTHTHTHTHTQNVICRHTQSHLLPYIERSFMCSSEVRCELRAGSTCLLCRSSAS